MPDAKITALTAITGVNLADGDMALLVDVSDTTMAASGTDKSTTINDIATAVKGRALVSAASVSTPGAGFAADTYLAGSGILIPTGHLQAQMIYRCSFDVTKTAAGVAAPVISVRVGTAGTTADTARATLTFPAQTAVIDNGQFDVTVVFRTVGSGTTAVLSARGRVSHNLSITGLSVGVTPTAVNVGGGFDSTVAASIIGLSVNGGTSAAWTITTVDAELVNLA